MNKEWVIVNKARSVKRPTSKDIINNIVKNFIELKGDGISNEDPSIIGGIGYLNDIPVTIIGQEKGGNTNDRIKHNFGMNQPSGFRKALNLMKQAEKFKRPIITIIDTPGAYPG